MGLPAGGSASDLALAVGAVPRLLGFEADLPGVDARLASDPVLASTLGALHGLRPARAETVFEALVMAVAAQQIAGAGPPVIRSGLGVPYGTRLEADGHEMHAFPTHETLVAAGVDGLRAHKLRWRKSEYIHGIEVQTLRGPIDDERRGRRGAHEAVGGPRGGRGGRCTPPPRRCRRGPRRASPGSCASPPT